LAIIAAVVGLFVGQAFHLVFDRVYTDTPLGGPLNRCPACRASLHPAHTLPLVGLVLSRGRCPHCSARFPWHALLLPVGAAALFAVSTLVFDELGAGLLGGFFATVFLVLTLTDLDRRLIPNRIVYPSVVLAIALSWGWPDSSVVDVLAGGLVGVAIAAGLLLFSLPFGVNAFGMGDVKMIVLIGFVVGLPAIIVGAFLGTIGGGVAAALLLLLRLRSRRDYIPHGPFLALGAIVALFWGQDIWDWYTDR